jgi:hypothetical protein
LPVDGVKTGGVPNGLYVVFAQGSSAFNGGEQFIHQGVAIDGGALGVQVVDHHFAGQQGGRGILYQVGSIASAAAFHYPVRGRAAVEFYNTDKRTHAALFEWLRKELFFFIV